MHDQRLTTIAVRQRSHLVRDLLVAAAGAVLIVFYFSAFTNAMHPGELVREAEPPAIEAEPTIALVDVEPRAA